MSKKGSLSPNPQLKSLGVAAIIGMALLFLLDFLGIVPVFQFLNIGRGGSPAGVVGPELKLSCPVAKELCGQGKNITFGGNPALSYGGNPALSYKLEPGTRVLAIANVTGSKDFSTDPFEKNSFRGLWQTSIFASDCYTVTYILSSDSAIKKFTGVTVQGDAVAILGKKTFAAGIDKANLVLKIQKRQIDPKKPGGSELDTCGIGNLQPGQFGDYLELKPSVFE